MGHIEINDHLEQVYVDDPPGPRVLTEVRVTHRYDVPVDWGWRSKRGEDVAQIDVVWGVGDPLPEIVPYTYDRRSMDYRKVEVDKEQEDEIYEAVSDLIGGF